MAIAVGVLPPPPAGKLPMQMTGSAERYGATAAKRRLAMRPSMRPKGASAEANAPFLRYHQNGVSRGMLQRGLRRQVVFEFGQSARQRPAHGRNGLKRPLGHRLPGAFVLDEIENGRGEACRVSDLLAASGAQERGVGVAEVLPVGTGEHRGAELDRLDRVLAAAIDERTADESDRHKRIEQA